MQEGKEGERGERRKKKIGRRRKKSGAEMESYLIASVAYINIDIPYLR
jgi:hypothetical protein